MKSAAKRCQVLAGKEIKVGESIHSNARQTPRIQLPAAASDHRFELDVNAIGKCNLDTVSKETFTIKPSHTRMAELEVIRNCGNMACETD